MHKVCVSVMSMRGILSVDQYIINYVMHSNFLVFDLSSMTKLETALVQRFSKVSNFPIQELEKLQQHTGIFPFIIHTLYLQLSKKI